MFASVRDVVPASITIDGDGDAYVPVRARSNAGFTGDLVALRYGDYAQSLLEIFVDISTGHFYRLAMPAWRRPDENLAAPPPLRLREGIAVLDLPTQSFEGPPGWWRIDCPNDFTLTLSGRDLTVAFDGAEQATNAIESGRLRFLASASKQFVGFQIRSLQEADVRTLMQFGAHP